MNSTIIISEDERDKHQANDSRASSVEFMVQHRVAPMISPSPPSFRTGLTASRAGCKKAAKKSAGVASPKQRTAVKVGSKKNPSHEARNDPEVLTGFDSETLEDDGFEVTGRKRGAGSLEYPDTELWSYDPNETEEDVLRSVSQHSSAAYQWPPLAASSSSVRSTPTSKRPRTSTARSAPTTPSKPKQKRRQTMGSTPLVEGSRARTAPNSPHRGSVKSERVPLEEGGGETDPESAGFEIVMLFNMLGDASGEASTVDDAEQLQAAVRVNEGSSRATTETASSGSRANVDRKMITWY
ncbi:unnamed protein product [Jaminaea pallidilutea]